MSYSRLQNKTIRPGSLRGYSYYYSNRIPISSIASQKTTTQGKPFHHRATWLFVGLLAVVALTFMYQGKMPKPSVFKQAGTNQALPVITAQSSAVTNNTVNHCASNTPEDKLIKISISQRHLWACQGTKSVQDAPVITGLQNHAETETPLGTYKVYAKQAKTTLTGSDSRGSWSDPVDYWMPFLDNQYGTYGFHDATWRSADAFGNISPDSPEASHGCVELPLATSKWLYDWSHIGTPVTVET